MNARAYVRHTQTGNQPDQHAASRAGRRTVQRHRAYARKIPATVHGDDEERARRLDRARHTPPGHDFGRIPVYPPEAPRAGSSFLDKAADGRRRPASLTPRVGTFPHLARLPAALQAGIETLSGVSLRNVQVHYNSRKPSELDALAYTRGPVIHVAPGQEKHLAHEAWHVVQQKQGRVQPTLLVHGVAVNDDAGLEHEADVMGRRSLKPDSAPSPARRMGPRRSSPVKATTSDVVQMTRYQATKDVRGVRMDVDIVNDEKKSRISIKDLTKHRGMIELRAFIDYVLDKNKKTLEISHFEAIPGATGLGTLLMYELATFAARNGIDIIGVQTPALSAMGAYVAFGGEARDPGLQAQMTEAYLGAYRKSPERHSRAVETEARELAEHARATEQYFSSPEDKEAEGRIAAAGETKFQEHMRAHSGPEDYERLAGYTALSSHLIYRTDRLLSTTKAKVEKQWTLIPEATRSGLFGFFGW